MPQDTIRCCCPCLPHAMINFVTWNEAYIAHLQLHVSATHIRRPPEQPCSPSCADKHTQMYEVVQQRMLQHPTCRKT